MVKCSWQYAGQEILICTYWGKNATVQVILLPIYGCALCCHSFKNSIRNLTVSYSDTFRRLINVPRYTSSTLAFEMNATDHINVVFRKFAYSLMSRVIASPNGIVTAIFNSDAYHQSPLMDKWENVICIGLIIDRIIPRYVSVWWMTM